jgi:hypothetical protein
MRALQRRLITSIAITHVTTLTWFTTKFGSAPLRQAAAA